MEEKEFRQLLYNELHKLNGHLEDANLAGIGSEIERLSEAVEDLVRFFSSKKAQDDLVG